MRHEQALLYDGLLLQRDYACIGLFVTAMRRRLRERIERIKRTGRGGVMTVTVDVNAGVSADVGADVGADLSANANVNVNANVHARRGAEALLRPHKTMRLAVTGDVRLTRLETEIVDTPEFQRLRGIRQLGTAHLVFPTALHTRFDHSLGVLSMTERMLRALDEAAKLGVSAVAVSPEQVVLARLFALLHDVTHVPFGHTIEDELSVSSRHDEDDARRVRLMGDGSRIGALIAGALGEELTARLWRLFRASENDSHTLADDAFLHDLVAGSIGADLLDYLKRDAFFCGLGLDSDDRLIDYFGLFRESATGAVRMAVRMWKPTHGGARADMVTAVTRLLDNRYLLAERVYFHHAKLVSGAMLAGAVVRAHEDGGERLLLETLSDDVLVYLLSQSRCSEAAGLAAGVRDRTLLKTISVMGRDEAEVAAGEIAPYFVRLHRDAAFRRAEEDALADALNEPRGSVLLYCPPPEMSTKIARTRVVWRDGLRALSECSGNALLERRLQITVESHRALWAVRVFGGARLRESADAMALCHVFLHERGGRG